MMRSRFTSWLILLALAPIGAHANASGDTIIPHHLDLARSIQLAYDHNPVINEAREKLVEQAGRLESTESLRFPKVNLSGLYQQDDNDRLGMFGGPGSEPDDKYWRAGVDLTQPLYSGGLLDSTVEARRLETRALESDSVATQSRVLANVHRNFYGALLAREVITVQLESISLLEQQLTLARNRFDAGAGARFDVLQAEVRLANAQPVLIRAQNDYRLAVDQLRTSLGARYGDATGPDDIALEGGLADDHSLLELDEALDEAMRQRPDLAAQAKRREAATQDLRRARAQRYPSLDLFANYGLEHDRYAADADPLEGWQAGITAKLQIWEGGRIRGEVAQAGSRLEQARLREDASRLVAELEVRNAWNKAREAREIMAAAGLVIKQAEEALRLAENRYGVGAITQLDVLSSQLEFTQAKLNRITAVHDYNVALVELDHAIGRIPGRQYLADQSPAF